MTTLAALSVAFMVVSALTWTTELVLLWVEPSDDDPLFPRWEVEFWMTFGISMVSSVISLACGIADVYIK